MLTTLKTALNIIIVLLFIIFSKVGHSKPRPDYINENTYIHFKCINGEEIGKNRLLVFLDNYITDYQENTDGSFDIGLDETYTTAKGGRFRLKNKASVVAFKPDMPETQNKTLFVLTKQTGSIQFEVISPLKLNNKTTCVKSTFSSQARSMLELRKGIGYNKTSDSDEDNYKSYVRKQISHNKNLLNRIFNRHSRKSGQKKAYLKLNILVNSDGSIKGASVIDTDISVKRTVNIIIARLKHFKMHKKYENSVGVEHQINFESK